MPSTTNRGPNNPNPRRRTALLWTVQGLLTCLFLFAGGVKLAMPRETLAHMTGLPGTFMQFIGVAELLGGLGLLLPGLLRIRQGLTRLAAAGLVVIMIGATTLTVAKQGIVPAALPFVTGALLVVVIRGRRQWGWHRGPSEPAAPHETAQA